jgi:hypothetical protein
MTTTTKARASADTAAQPRRRYKDDLYGWVEEQVALLKAGRLSEIDSINIADELGDVGSEQYDKLESAVHIVLLHLLKWDHQPSHRSKSWAFSIRTQRRQIARVLKKNPSLKPHIAEAIGEAHEDARDDAQNETGLPATTFPVDCPYDWDTILTRVIEFDDIRSPES